MNNEDDENKTMITLNVKIQNWRSKEYTSTRILAVNEFDLP